MVPATAAPMKIITTISQNALAMFAANRINAANLALEVFTGFDQFCFSNDFSQAASAMRNVTVKNPDWPQSDASRPANLASKVTAMAVSTPKTINCFCQRFNLNLFVEFMFLAIYQ